MPSLKSGLVSMAVAGLFATAAIVGCSADGGGGIASEGSPTEPEPEAVLPPPSGNGGSGSTTDAGKKDSGGSTKTDSGVDAGPPPPVEGTACTKADEIRKKKCGACGEASTVCIDDGSGLKWSTYSPCENELVGGCVPGTVVDEPCGNCGTVKKTCTQYCAFTSGTCMGQPAMSCKPGSIEYTTAGCGTSTYRNRTCGTACTWGGYTATCEEPNNPNKMTISASVNGLVSSNWTLSASQVGKKPTTCPGSGSTASNYPYVAVEVKNPTAQTATIQIYHSGSGTPVDTIIWVYKKILPADDTTVGTCDFGVGDSCLTGDPCGNSANGGSSYDWAGLDNVTIPPNGKVLVYSAGYTSTDVGAFTLNIKTKSLM